MPGAIPGTQYFGSIDGVRTTAILVSVPDPNDPESMYLLAVPPPTPDADRLQQVRDPQHPEEMLPVVLKALDTSGMKGLRRAPPSLPATASVRRPRMRALAVPCHGPRRHE